MIDFEEVKALFMSRRFGEIVEAVTATPAHDYRLGILKSAALAELGRFDEAISNLDHEFAEPDARLASWITKSNICILAERYNEALHCAQMALAISPNRTEALINASTALISVARFRDAIAILNGKQGVLLAEEQLNLLIAQFREAPKGDALPDMIRLCREVANHGASVMAAVALCECGYYDEAIEIIGPFKHASPQASEAYALALTKAGFLDTAREFANTNLVGLNAKAVVFCAIREQEKISSLQADSMRSPRAYYLLQEESVLPGSTIHMVDPPKEWELARAISQRSKLGWSLDAIMEVMQLALDLGESGSISSILRRLQQLPPDGNFGQAQELLSQLRLRQLISQKDAAWSEYKLCSLSGDVAGAWKKLAALNHAQIQDRTLEKPSLPEAARKISVNFPVILLFGMSRSGKSTLATHLAQALPQFMFLDELKILPNGADIQAMEENLEMLGSVHPGGIILTVPHPGERSFINLLGHRLVKSVLVLRDELDLAFRIFEKDYKNSSSHAYSYSLASCFERVQWYQQAVAEKLMREGNAFAIRYEEFNSQAKMDELARYIGCTSDLQALPVKDAGASDPFRDQMMAMLNRSA